MYHLGGVGRNSDTQQDSSVVFVDALLSQAIDQGASDIHIEPTKDNLRIRFRLDGQLYDQPATRMADRMHIISRLKILACLDIAQTRTPQDGKLLLCFAGRSIDMRIATFPTLYGEKLVVRILDQQRQRIVLSDLGFSPQIYVRLQNIIARQQGFFLVTGPTGSGKTTTLYAMLAELNDARKNIVTMEDPIEYTLSGIMQSQVNPQAGLTFESGLRALLRQDPDVMMIGEIRDFQTLQIATQAALTGHLVLSTLHTSDAIGVITRLRDMGLESYLINDTICGVLAQRLVRLLCQECKVPIDLSLEQSSTLFGRDAAISRVYQAGSCAECLYTGYKGRAVVAQLLELSDELCSLIQACAPTKHLREQAVKDGMTLLHDDAQEKLRAGYISLDEYRHL